MKTDFPRVMLAAPKSGEGKTTVVCAILQALVDRKMKPCSCKCGPDFIDPLFHREIIGADSGNLDLFFTDENTTCALYAKKATGCDISVIEGVMGFYDGLSGTSEAASSYHLAKTLRAPVVLVINARGASLSLLAAIKGFCEFEPDSNIRAVILNQCTKSQFEILKPLIESRLGIRALGYLEKNADYALESRHLGLVTAAEVSNLKAKLSLLAQAVACSVDIDGLISIAQAAPPLEYEPFEIKKITEQAPTIAVARDMAFCFYYDENLSLLQKLGARLVEFSPLADASLPADADALYIGGGYPELYARQLENNAAMRCDIAERISGGLPTLAECGGFMFLQKSISDINGVDYEMVGAIDGKCVLSERLSPRFGYISLCADSDNLLCKKGGQIGAHEFHYSDSTFVADAFTASKPNSKRSWRCIYSDANIFAGYPHLYFYSNPAFAESFVRNAARYKENKNA
ncbi:MAG: cobyrinate a,c-diamide synthase [Oscillospiraceae bacterium]